MCYSYHYSKREQLSTQQSISCYILNGPYNILFHYYILIYISYTQTVAQFNVCYLLGTFSVIKHNFKNELFYIVDYISFVHVFYVFAGY